jgi:transcriptional regulator with XRE-family HTH domain
LQPKKLHSKLERIRATLSLSQEQMAERLKDLPEASIHPGHISQFETGKREPSLLVLLAYARMAGVSTDHLIDDRLDLPEEFTSRRMGKETGVTPATSAKPQPTSRK